jgi:hypothetical protein
MPFIDAVRYTLLNSYPFVIAILFLLWLSWRKGLEVLYKSW